MVATKTQDTQETKEELVIVLPVMTKEGDYHPLPKDQRDNSTKISSEFRSVEGKITPNIIKGLDREQERYFLSDQLGIDTDSKDWEKAIRGFWAEFTVKVPAKGLTLNKATIKKQVVIDGNKLEIDFPVNLQDYMMYSFLMQSSQIAKTQEDKDNLDLFKAYVEDLSVIKQREVKSLVEKDEADINYVSLLSDKEQSGKIEWLLEKFRKPEENFVSFSLEDKKLKLRQIKDEYPVIFNQEFNNPNLEEEALISQLVKYDILSKDGKLYFNGTENLGSIKETTEWFKDSGNSDNIRKFKALLDQKIKSVKNIK